VTKPDFLGPVERAEDFHLNKAGLMMIDVEPQPSLMLVKYH
jgi:hypothetical protein